MLLAQGGQWLTADVSCKINGRMFQRNQRRFSRDHIAWRHEINGDKWAMVSNTIRCSIVGPVVDGTPLVAPYLGPIQYFITLSVNRLNRSDGWCILTIRHTGHGVHTAKGRRFFLILNIDWKDWSKQQALLQKKSPGMELCREVKKKQFRQKENN